MRVRMTKSIDGAEDGVTVRRYEAGSVYDLAETPRGRELAEVFLREKWAVPADAPAEEAAPVVEAAPPTAPEGDKPKPRGKAR